jgi:DNA-binding NtrC family response regulator
MIVNPDRPAGLKCQSQGESHQQQNLIADVRIMVVDDERDIAYIIKRSLELHGSCSVDSFTNPEEALSHFKPNNYSLSIVDIGMPNMNGFELYREMRKKDPNVKTCFLTAYENYNDEFRKVFPSSVEVRCIMKKPISLEYLVKHVKQEVLETKRVKENYPPFSNV